MESIYNTKTRSFVKISDEDFDKFQQLFSDMDSRSPEEAFSDYESCKDDEGFEKDYTQGEVEGAFNLHAEYTGLDKEIAKDNIADLSERRIAEEELKKFIKDKTPISVESANTILKVLEAFDSYECSIEDY